MDLDHGIYPYTESFNTTTGSVCIGLGVPDEAIETEIGVVSVITMLRRSFLKYIPHFPTHILPDEPAHDCI